MGGVFFLKILYFKKWRKKGGGGPPGGFKVFPGTLPPPPPPTRGWVFGLTNAPEGISGGKLGFFFAFGDFPPGKLGDFGAPVSEESTRKVCDYLGSSTNVKPLPPERAGRELHLLRVTQE